MKKLIYMSTLALIAAFGIFWSCQKEELTNPEEGLMLKGGKVTATVVETLSLDFPAIVNVNEDFDIVFSSPCGKLTVERGYILDVDGVTHIYQDLTCETAEIQFEAIESGGYSNCSGGTHTENWSEEGTYIYRTKWNFNAENKSECIDCIGFTGNESSCFMVKVINEDCDESFSYETLDNLSMIFTYVSDVSNDNAEVKITCPHILGFTPNDGKLYEVNNVGNQTVLTWTGGIGCTPVTFDLTFNPDCGKVNTGNGNINICTDFKVNGISKKTVTPPEIGASCETIEEVEVCSWPTIKYSGCQK